MFILKREAWRALVSIATCATFILGPALPASARTERVDGPYENAFHWESNSVGCGETVTCNANGFANREDGSLSATASVLAPPRASAENCSLFGLSCEPTPHNVGWAQSNSTVGSTFEIPENVDAVRIEIRARLDKATISQTTEENAGASMYVSALAGGGLYQDGHFLVMLVEQGGLEQEAGPVDATVVFTLRQTEDWNELGTLHVWAANHAFAQARNGSVAGSSDAHDEKTVASVAGRLLSIRVTQLNSRSK